MVLVTRQFTSETSLMNLSIANGGYALLRRIDLFNAFYVIMKRVPIVSNLYDISTKDLLELTLYENDMKVPKFKKRLVKVHLEV